MPRPQDCAASCRSKAARVGGVIMHTVSSVTWNYYTCKHLRAVPSVTRTQAN